MKQVNGSGIIGVHAYEDTTGIFLVMPTKHVELKEGIYEFNFF